MKSISIVIGTKSKVNKSTIYSNIGGKDEVQRRKCEVGSATVKLKKSTIYSKTNNKKSAIIRQIRVISTPLKRIEIEKEKGLDRLRR